VRDDHPTVLIPGDAARAKPLSLERTTFPSEVSHYARSPAQVLRGFGVLEAGGVEPQRPAS